MGGEGALEGRRGGGKRRDGELAILRVFLTQRDQLNPGRGGGRTDAPSAPHSHPRYMDALPFSLPWTVVVLNP